MPADPSMQADPSVGSSAGGDDDSQDAQGVTVCITASPDGTFSVQIQESGDSDQSGEDESGDGPQSADNLQDALKLAGQMLTAEQGEESSESGDDNEPMDPGAAKSAWNQMAAKRDSSRSMG
jgi:hypothetical protein